MKLLWMNKMVKKYLFLLLLAITLIGFVSAVDTEIKIKTVPSYEVQVAASEKGLFTARDKIQSDQYGDAYFNLSISDSVYTLDIFIKKDGETVLSKRLPSLVSGEPVNEDLVPEWFTPIPTPSTIENLSVENSTVDEENSTMNLN